MVSKCINLIKRKNSKKRMMNRNFAPFDDFHPTLKTSIASGCLLCSFDKKVPDVEYRGKDPCRIHGESMSRVPLHVLQDMHCYTMLYI